MRHEGGKSREAEEEEEETQEQGTLNPSEMKNRNFCREKNKMKTGRKHN